MSTKPSAPHLTLVSADYHEPPSYTCLACSGTCDERFLLCPGCGAFETCVLIEDERGPETPDATPKRARNARFIVARKLALVSTGRPVWDRVLGGGVPRASSILVAGRGGAGKSTAALDMARHVARALGGPVLYASAEMPEERVRLMADRLGYSAKEIGALFITDTKELGDVVRDVGELEPAVIVWDSIQRFSVDGHRGDRELLRTVATALELGAALEAVTFLLSQVTKDGTPVGPNGIDHDADIVVFLRRTRGGRIAVDIPEKNRFAPTPARAYEGAVRRRRRPSAQRRDRKRGSGSRFQVVR